MDSPCRTGATRAPDTAWVSSERLQNLSQEAKEPFLPLAPDVAVEVRSQNDRREDLEGKMREYVANGKRLGWLVDPYDETVTVYRDDEPVETHEQPNTLSGDPVFPGFTCDLGRVWDPSY